MADDAQLVDDGGNGPAKARVSIQEMHHLEKMQSRIEWSPLRLMMGQVMESMYFEVGMGAIICFNAVLIIHATDMRASHDDEPAWLLAADALLLMIYSLDLIARMYVYRCGFFQPHSNKLDFFVTTSDLVTTTMVSVVGDIPSFSFLRICRIFRLLRFMKALLLVRELNLMLIGFAGAMKAMFWAGVMLLCMLTLWSVLAVELLHPINLKLADQGLYIDCERCPRAFSTVMQSNLTFIQQIVAGDSWGRISVPMIEEEPLTALLFFGVMITINLGVLNLVLTVIVDIAQTAREQDTLKRLEEKANKFETARKELVQLCKELDADGSGELSLEELMEGVEVNPRFAATMAVMDVRKEDMHIIFNILDEDNSGTVTYSEFVEHLYKMKSQDNHTMLIFIKGYLCEVRRKISEQMSILKDDVSWDTKELVQVMNRLLYGETPPEAVSVSIEGVCGLSDAERKGSAETFCICEVEGKPNTSVETERVAERAETVWDCTETIHGFAPGDDLVFSLMGGDGCGQENLLGRAVLPSAQFDGGTAIFNGELALESNNADSEARIRVRVAPVPKARVSARSSSRGSSGYTYGSEGGTSEAGAGGGRKGGSLVRIEEELHRICTQIEGELAGLARETAGKVNEQIALLQDWKPTSWPPAAFRDVQEEDPLTPASIGSFAGDSKLDQSHRQQPLHTPAGDTVEQQDLRALSNVVQGLDIPTYTAPYSRI